MSYLISIVVPTKDRYEYLKPLILLVKGFNSDEIELVIQDNTADNGEIVKFISELNYPQLKYFHSPEQISVSYNSDLAILNSTGKYICLIGDDDGVSAHIVSAAKWMDKMEIDVLKTAFCTYKWPSFNFSRLANFSSVLMISYYDKNYRKIDPIPNLKKMLRTGGNKFRYLPKVYHGIARRSTLDKIYLIGGTYFPGASPDVANAVALSFVAENFVFLNFPVVIPGNSNRTGGDVQKYKGLCAPVSDIPFLPKNTLENWEKFIPKIWSCETIIPESACKSLIYMGKGDFIQKYLNKEKMIADFVAGHFNLKELAIQISSNIFILYAYLILIILKKYSFAIFNKVIYSFLSVNYLDNYYKGGIFNKKNYIKVVTNLLNIEEANNYLIQLEKTFDVKS